MLSTVGISRGVRRHAFAGLLIERTLRAAAAEQGTYRLGMLIAPLGVKRFSASLCRYCDGAYVSQSLQREHGLG